MQGRYRLRQAFRGFCLPRWVTNLSELEYRNFCLTLGRGNPKALTVLSHGVNEVFFVQSYSFACRRFSLHLIKPIIHDFQMSYMRLRFSL